MSCRSEVELMNMPMPELYGLSCRRVEYETKGEVGGLEVSELASEDDDDDAG